MIMLCNIITYNVCFNVYILDIALNVLLIAIEACILLNKTVGSFFLKQA